MRFRKINEQQMSSGAVTLAIKRTDEGALFGRVIATILKHAGPEAVMRDEPVPQAIATASHLAGSAEKTVVDVVDEEDKWQPDWGVLESS